MDRATHIEDLSPEEQAQRINEKYENGIMIPKVAIIHCRPLSQRAYLTYSAITIFQYILLFRAREFVARLLSDWWRFPPRQPLVSHIHAR